MVRIQSTCDGAKQGLLLAELLKKTKTHLHAVNERDQQNILGVQKDDLEVKLRNHCIVYVGHYKMERALWVGFSTSSVPKLKKRAVS